MARERDQRHASIDELIAELETAFAALPRPEGSTTPGAGVVLPGLDRGETIVGVDLNG
jgi:hypothetical protein